MAVKIFIKRRIKKAKADEAIALMNKFRMDAMNQPGYISGETLVNHYDPQRVTVVSTWQSVDDWINWEQSDQRAATEEQLESLLLEPTRFEIYDLGILPKK
jgi:heme-degrading monooxygenase HmoA